MNPAPDLILHSACIHTCSGHTEPCQAIALTGPLIAAVGTNADVLALRGPSTRVLDLQGRAVIPGMTDGHAHMDREGLRHHLPDLSDAHSIQDILDVIADEAANTPAGQWIVTQPIGRPPEYQDPLAALKEGRYPTRRDLDAVSPNHPVYIRPIWGYWRNQPPLVSVANSLALQRAGVTAETRAPSPDITIDRDDAGEPTGVFIERTLVPVVEHSLMRAAPGFSVDQRVSGLRHAMAVYNRYGTTAVFEGHGVADEVLEAYQRVHRQGEDSVRATLVFSPNWAVRASGEASDLLRDWAGWAGAAPVMRACAFKAFIPSWIAIRSIINCAPGMRRAPAGLDSRRVRRCRNRPCMRCWSRRRARGSGWRAFGRIYCPLSSGRIRPRPLMRCAGCWDTRPL